MNSDVKRSNINIENKNLENFVPHKEPVRCSILPKYSSCSSKTTEDPQLHNETNGRTDRDLPTSITKRLRCNLAEKNPKTDASSKEIHSDKHRKDEFDKAAARKSRNSPSTQQEGKKSRILVSSKKADDSVSQKRQFGSNDDRKNSKNELDAHLPKKFSHKAIRGKAKETCHKNVQPAAKNVVDRTTGNDIETVAVEEKPKISRIKKYSVHANVKDKIGPNKKKIDNSTDCLKKALENKEIFDVKTVIVSKKSVHEETNCNNDAREENNGSARTRIFQRKKRSKVDENLIRYDRDIRDRKRTGNLKSKPSLEKNNTKRHEIDNKSMNKNSKQDSVDSACSTTSDNVISLFQRGLSTIKSNHVSNQFQEVEANYRRSIEEGGNDFALEAGNGPTSCKKVSLLNTDEDSSRADAKKKHEEESITDPISAVDHDQTEIMKSQTASEVSSLLQDNITYYTNSMNHKYNSDQQYCKGISRENLDGKYAIDEIKKLSKQKETKDMRGDDAKYNLMKALIHPAPKIPHFKGTEESFTEISESGQRLESLLARKNEGVENYYGNSSSNGSMTADVTPSPSDDVQRLKNDAENSKSVDSLNPHASAMHFRPSLMSQTSDYDAANSKMKGCKYTKKYRHFKYEEKNMCRNIARYIERMISNERKYQRNSKRLVDPEGEDMEIIIEKSPKTSRIRIVNDHSSVSVMCHSLRRIISPNEQNNNVVANKAEYSGGESSGYKSLQNSKTKHFDFVDRTEVKSMIEREIHRSDKSTSHNRPGVHVPSHNPFPRYESLEKFIDKVDITSAQNSSDHLREEDLETEENPKVKKYGKRSTDIDFTPSDTNIYLSPFTKYMNVYLPSEITAYQLNKVNGNKTLQFNDYELLEKDIDDAELRIGKNLMSEHSDSESESSSEEESSVQPSSVKGNETVQDEMIVVKPSDNLMYKSSEMVVDKRFLEPNNAEARNDSTDVPAAPAQLKIITSLVDMESVEPTSESSSILDVKLETENVISTPKVNSIEPRKAETVSKNAHSKPTSHRTSCFKKFKNRWEKPNDKSTVHKLWANKKSTIDSTDNESQTSVKSRSTSSEGNKFKFNIFKKSSVSSSEKSVKVSFDQLPQPQPPFLESSVTSRSTIISSTADNESFESEDLSKPSVDITSILSKNLATEFHTDNVASHQTDKTHKNSNSNGRENFTEFQPKNPVSVPHEDFHAQPGTSAVSPLTKKVFQEAEEPLAAVPPPASAVPPPYPFCCPMAPYMTQHWQNYQQPPPAWTVPLPEPNWKSNVGPNNGVPPPPGSVPIPWFPRVPLKDNDTLPTGAGGSANNFYAQPPPEWLMMPRGYAPCLPCSKTPELRLKKTDSSIDEEVEPVFETIESKQDVKKKTVSNKLFKIFRRKNKGDVDAVEEDERKGKNMQSRSELKQIQKVRVERNEKQISEDRSIWESPDIAGIVTPEEIGRCFRRGFRADGLTLSGDDYLCTRAPSDTASAHEDVFNFSEHDTPLDFLLALGFSVDEATAAIRDDEVRRRFKAALTEARIWVPHIATTQGTLLYLLAMKAKPKVMRYFLQLVESIVNKRITNAVKLDAYLKILEMVEDGYVSFVTLFGKETGQEDEEDTVIVEKQRRRIFYTIYKYAEAEAEEVNRPLTKASVDLLHSLAARYRSAIGPHLRLLACYIGEGLLTKDVQLEAALIYLSRLNSADVRLADLEIYCGLPPSERRRVEQIAREQSPDKV